MDNVTTTETVDNSSSTTTTPPQQEPTIHDAKSVSGANIFAIFALLLAVVACIGNGFLFWWSKQQISTRSEQFQIINQQQTNTTQQLTQQFVQLQNQLLQQQNTVSEMQTSVQKLIQNQPGTNRVWTLAEVNYLVNLAHLQLQYNHSTAGAIILLQEANQRLSHLVDPSLSPVTQAINSALTKLQSLPEINLVDILNRLNKLHESVNLLEQVAPIQTAATTNNATTTNATAEHISWWKKITHTVTNSFKQLVVINYHNKPLPQFMPPEQQLFLQQNIQLVFEQAQWAVMHNNQTVFENSLETAKNWIKQNYIQDAPNTKAFLQEINSLQSIKLQQPYPDLTTITNLTNSVITATPPESHK